MKSTSSIGRTPLLLVGLLACAPACSSQADSGAGDSNGGTGNVPAEMGGAGNGGGGKGGVDYNGTAPPSEPNRPITHDAAAGAPPGNSAALCGSTPDMSRGRFDASPADTGSMAVATRSREALQAGQIPAPAGIRTNDFLNYYARSSAPKVPDNTLVTKIEFSKRQLGQTEIPGQYDLFVGVWAGAVSPRPRTSLTLVVDTSTSMATAGLERAQTVLAALGNGLEVGDHVTLLTNDPGVPARELDLVDPPSELGTLAANLTPGSEDAVVDRLPAAYERAHAFHQPGSWSRVVVISDGEGNADSLTLSLIEGEAASGYLLTAVGVHTDAEYGDGTLFRLARVGRGRYLYVDGQSTADELFDARFDEMFGVVRDDLKIHVELPWFLTSLEEELVAQDGAYSPSLAPNGSARFVFRVGGCSAGVAEGDTTSNIVLTVNSVSPAGDPLTEQTTALLTDLFAANPVERDQMLATDAFISALKNPVASRFQEAEDRLKPLSGPAFLEMKELLAKHPKH